MSVKKRLNEEQIHTSKMFNYCNDERSKKELQEIL